MQVETKFGMKGFIPNLSSGEMLSSYPILLHQREVDAIKERFDSITEGLSTDTFHCFLKGDSIEAVSYHKLDTSLKPEKYLIKR